MTGILYFSSTGNSLYIAQRVKKAIGGQVKYIPNYDGDGCLYKMWEMCFYLFGGQHHNE